MRKIQRQALTQATTDKLATLTDKIKASADPKAAAQTSWKSQPKAAFAEIRSKLEQMASGRSRCMYCEDSLGTDIDHFWPKADYPLRAFTWENYLLACSHCNSNLKRHQFPLDAAAAPLLIDPTVDDPPAHLIFTPSTGAFVERGPKGAASIQVFGLNDDSSPRRLPSGRKQALIALVALLKDYDREVSSNPAKANEIKETIQDYPFSAVLHWLVGISQLPAGNIVLGADVIRLVQTHGVSSWL